MEWQAVGTKTVKRMIPPFGEGGAVSLPQFAQSKDAGKHSKEGTLSGG